MEIFLAIIFIIFLVINYKIIYSDIINKVIPNKLIIYLLCLLPFYYIYIYLNNDINYIDFIFQIFLTITISFLLYYFGIWGAGDSKYILILGLFIPHIGIDIFIINLGIIFISYIILYSTIGYFIKYFKDLNYRKKIYLNIKNDFNKSIKKLKDKKTDNINLLLVTKFILNFMIIFISFRIYRIHIIENSGILKNVNISSDTKIILLILFSILFIYLIKKIGDIIKDILTKKLSMTDKEKDIIFFLTILLSFILFLLYEVLNNNIFKTFNEIYKITTLYILIFISIRLVIYLYKINFSINEVILKNVNNIKVDDLLDKQYLISKIGNMGMLIHYQKLGVKLKGRDKKRLGIGKYKDFYNNINYKLEKDDIYKIKNHFMTIKKINKNFNLPNIKIVKTFAFAGYIFIGFIATYLFGNIIIKTLIGLINNLVY